VPNLPIEDRLKYYFLAMGAQQTERAQICQNNLAFLWGNEKVHVVILSNKDVVERNKILNAILSLTSLRHSSQLLYLAAPRILGASVDADIFKLHGIGLLLFDERRIDEAVSPQVLRPSEQILPPSQLPDQAVFAELASLKSMYIEIERTIASLREDVRTVIRDSENHPRMEIAHASSQIPRSEPDFTTPSGLQLPSFFANNPWLDVLSKRGRSGDEPIAG
jgi:hypothetical protein